MKKSRKVWSKQQAGHWGEATGWLVGCNYTPRTAGNQIEMWSKKNFDPKTIEQELSWAEDLGFNAVRIYLHDLLWQEDAKGLLTRMDRFLKIAKRHGIKAMPVFFDSCWHPFPRLGKQRGPEPHVHNSMWLQSPGVDILRDAKRFARLKSYVVGVMKHFADDPRIALWDLWNEPDNSNGASYGPRDLGDHKGQVMEPLLRQVFDWARGSGVSQPLTSGVWQGDWSAEHTLKSWERLQLEQSDVISFHCYEPAATMEKKIKQLQQLGRPLVCSEYLARGTGSTFETILPLLKRHGVGALNWGFVAGRTQTLYPWDSWQKRYDAEPKLWFHEIFRADGKPYRATEVRLIRKIGGK